MSVVTVGQRRVSAIIVSYNTRELLRQSIESVLRPGQHVSREIECIVVDNASQDGSAEMVAAEFPEIVLLLCERNLGFAAAVNRGLLHARADYVLLLNPDAELLDDALARMVQFLDAHHGVAAVGPRLTYGDGSSQHAAFAFPTLPMIFLDFFPLHRRLLGSRLNGRYPGSAGPHPIGHPLGACMLVRRQALDEVGPMDERFFMYCEEVDWCMRAQRLGWKVYHLPEAKARHLGAQSTRQQRDPMFVTLHRSRLRLYRKHYGWLFRTMAKVITWLGLWAEERRARRAGQRGELSAEELVGRLRAIAEARGLLRTES